MLRMYGTTVQICRYRVEWTDASNDMSRYAYTEAEANVLAERYNGTITKLDTSQEDWMDGMTFNSRDEAVAWSEKGEAAYKAMLQEQQRMSMEQLRADIDFSMAMGGYV